MRLRVTIVGSLRASFVPSSSEVVSLRKADCSSLSPVSGLSCADPEPMHSVVARVVAGYSYLGFWACMRMERTYQNPGQICLTR